MRYLFFLLLFTACASSEEKIIRELMGKQMTISDSLAGRYKGRDTTLTINDKQPTIVCYYNAQGCSSCKLKELADWKYLLKEVDSLTQICFIFNVGKTKIAETDRALLLHNFDYPVYYDHNNIFERTNKLPTNNRFHTFLLDKDNNIVLVGSPVHNEKLWELYKQTI